MHITRTVPQQDSHGLYQEAPAGKPKQAAGRPFSAGGADPAAKRAAAHMYQDDIDGSLEHPGMAAPRRQRAAGSRSTSASETPGQRYKQPGNCVLLLKSASLHLSVLLLVHALLLLQLLQKHIGKGMSGQALYSASRAAYFSVASTAYSAGTHAEWLPLLNGPVQVGRLYGIVGPT